MQIEHLYSDILDNLYEGVYFVDKERRISFWNKAAEDITGYTKEEVVGDYCHNNLLNHIDKDGRVLCISGCPLHATMIDGGHRKAKVFLRHKEGHRKPVQVSIFPIEKGEQIIGAVEIFTQSSPITYDDDTMERLSGVAMFDRLTGLANQKKLESYLDYKLNELRRFKSKFCVIFLSIDDLDALIHKHGQGAGDQILKSISRSINNNMRNDDLFGCWGNEMFAGIFAIKNDYEATLAAEKIRILVEKSEVLYDKKRFSVTASIGVTVAHKNDTIKSVVDRINSFLYSSKPKNKNCVTHITSQKPQARKVGATLNTRRRSRKGL